MTSTNSEVKEYPSLEEFEIAPKNYFRILYLNSRSIKNKLDVLEVIIKEIKP